MGALVSQPGAFRNALQVSPLRIATLVAEARDAGLPGEKIVVYGSEKLADWCNQYPAIAARVAGAPAGLSTFDVRYRVEQFHDRMGIAPRGGRYRYISPEPTGGIISPWNWSWTLT